MKRRQFTTSLANIAALSSLFGPALFAAGKPASAPVMARGRFERLLGQEFIIHGDDGDSRLRLIRVESAIRDHDEEQFNVMFNTREGPVLPEGIYILEANGKPEIGLHLMPGRSRTGQQNMIACINLQTAA